MYSTRHTWRNTAVLILAACSIWLAPGSDSLLATAGATEAEDALTGQGQPPGAPATDTAPAGPRFSPRWSIPLTPQLRKPGAAKRPGAPASAGGATAGNATAARVPAVETAPAPAAEPPVPMTILQPHCEVNADGQELPAADPAGGRLVRDNMSHDILPPIKHVPTPEEKARQAALQAQRAAAAREQQQQAAATKSPRPGDAPRPIASETERKTALKALGFPMPDHQVKPGRKTY